MISIHEHRNIDLEKLEIDIKREFNFYKKLVLMYWFFIKKRKFNIFLDEIEKGKSVKDAYTKTKKT